MTVDAKSIAQIHQRSVRGLSGLPCVAACMFAFLTQPVIAMRRYKDIVGKMGINLVYTVDFFALAGRKCFMFIEAPYAFQKPLASQHFMQSSDASRKLMHRIEECCIAVSDLLCERQELNRDFIAAIFC